MSISLEASRSIEAAAERWCVRLSRNGMSTHLVHILRVTAVEEILQHFGSQTDAGTIGVRDITRFEAGRSELAKYALREILRQELPRQRTPPRQRVPLRRMSSAETARTIAALTPHHWRDFASLVIGTDLTVREALALEWDDVDSTAATAQVTRMTSVPRTVHLNCGLVALIESQPRTGAGEARVFPLSRTAATRALQRAMTRAGTGGPGRGWQALTRRRPGRPRGP